MPYFIMHILKWRLTKIQIITNTNTNYITNPFVLLAHCPFAKVKM